ncbi:MAG: gamma-glutamyltransferase [Bradymonadaceae bacterium]
MIAALIAPAIPQLGTTAELPDSSPTVTTDAGIVAADHPIASKIGARVLADGGTAMDAGIATLLALGVVNPFSSGLGGGGFCLYRPSSSGRVTVFDFREVAPMKATRDMYVVDGEVKQKWMLRGGKAVGVPGEPAGLWAMAHHFGSLDWKRLVEPAHRLAEEGHRVTSLLVERLKNNAEKLNERPTLAGVFQEEDGSWVDEGDTLTRPALARSLNRLRNEGSAPFYHGEIASAIVDAVNRAGGIFQRKDLRRYAIATREPISGTYRGYQVYGMPPSSSGGTTLVETLNILEGYDLTSYGRTPKGIHLIVEALKHAFADRAAYLGDTDFAEVPLDRLTSQSYADKLRAQIKPASVLAPKSYGTKAPLPDDHGTTHVSVVDAERNMLACTSTINLSFGSMVFVPEWGLILNDEMGDFTAQPGVANNYGLVGTEKNAVAPRKRPLSSMSPTLILDPEGRPYMAIGASGGPAIITGTLFGFLNTVEFGMSPSEAIAAPRIHHQWMPYKLFMEAPAGMRSELEQMGHEIEVRPAWSNVQMVVRSDDSTWTGVSDPRKGGRPAASDRQSPGSE